VGSGPVGERATPTPGQDPRRATRESLDRANSFDYVFQCPSGPFEW